MTAVETIAAAVRSYNAHWTEADFIDTHPDIFQIMTDYWNLADAEPTEG